MLGTTGNVVFSTGWLSSIYDFYTSVDLAFKANVQQLVHKLRNIVFFYFWIKQSFLF